jgi:hypothetical protein
MMDAGRMTPLPVAARCAQGVACIKLLKSQGSTRYRNVPVAPSSAQQAFLIFIAPGPLVLSLKPREMMRVFKTILFRRFQRKERMSNDSLGEGINRAE